MLPITINDTSAWLLTAFPNTGDAVTLRVRVPVDGQRALTGRSSQRPQAEALRCALQWVAMMRGEDFAALRNATLGAQNEPVCVPLWPHAIRVGTDAATISSGLTIAWTRGWATYAVNPVSLAGYDFAAPLLFGFLSQPPREAGRNGELVRAEFSFEEDSDAAHAIDASTPLVDVTFNTASGIAYPVFPFAPEVSTPPNPGVGVVEAQRNAVGPGRLKSTVFYPQPRERVQDASFKLRTPAEAAKLIAWWRQRAGNAGAHWVAGTQLLGRLAADLGVGNTVLNFAGAIAPLGPIAYVSLSAPGGSLAFARVDGSTSTSVTLHAGLAAGWSALGTIVAPAMLARHTREELTLDYRRANESWIATTSLAWREDAYAYTTPAGETRGTTIGRLKPPAWFFKIELDYNGAVKTWHLTNWESGAYANLVSWDYNACDFDKIIRAIDPEDDSFTFNFRWFAGGPWENWQPGQLHARGFVTIYRAESNGDGTFADFRQVIKGELVTPSGEQPEIRQRALGANALFALMVPRRTMGKSCGTCLFSATCTLQRADWTFSAVIAAVAGNTVTVGTIARTNADPLPDGFGAVDWFALGYMEWLIGGAPMRASIASSTALDGGTLQVELELPCPVGGGSAVTLVPGCDLLRDSGCTKFGNTDNFQNFSEIPAVNPSFILPSRKFTSAKK